MSHYRLKAKYNTEGSYGGIEQRTVYAYHNLSCDYVTFYDDSGEYIMSIPDTIVNNLLDSINKLYMPFQDGKIDYGEGIEAMDENDCKKCGL